MREILLFSFLIYDPQLESRILSNSYVLNVRAHLDFYEIIILLFSYTTFLEIVIPIEMAIPLNRETIPLFRGITISMRTTIPMNGV
jgi:hypothetical protein